MGIDTSDEWIRTRTGIRERHIAEGETEGTTQLASNAGRMAVKNAGIELKDIELIVIGTLTPDRSMPSAGCAVGNELGLNGTPAFDVYCACSGFIYGMDAAEGLMKTRGYKYALVIGAESLSKFTDWTDRSTCVLFGDGAGAVVLKVTDEPAVGIIDSLIGADGSYSEALKLDHGGKIQMAGREIFKNAVTLMGDSVLKLLERNKLSRSDIKLVIPHQANNRIIEAISERIEIPMERFFLMWTAMETPPPHRFRLRFRRLWKRTAPKGRLPCGRRFWRGLTWGATLKNGRNSELKPCEKR
jgi:3-oxoacyl-[acyl-carrier-protein] synthase-3